MKCIVKSDNPNTIDNMVVHITAPQDHKHSFSIDGNI